MMDTVTTSKAVHLFYILLIVATINFILYEDGTNTTVTMAIGIGCVVLAFACLAYIIKHGEFKFMDHIITHTTYISGIIAIILWYYFSKGYDPTIKCNLQTAATSFTTIVIVSGFFNIVQSFN